MGNFLSLRQLGDAEPNAVQSPRHNLQSHWPEWTAVTVYVGLVASVLPRHEPVADEAQAWQLVRTLPLGRLFHTQLGYEGAPGLWYALLAVLMRAHVSYAGLHWICGVIASAGVTLLVFRAPFPRFIKLLLPFTFFLAFQYAIVARSYVLFPLLVFVLAASWKSGRLHPWRIALILGFIANISLHCAVISGGFAIVYAVELFRNRVAGGAKPPGFGRLIGAASILLVFYSLTIWTVLPPPDIWVANHISDNTNTGSDGQTSAQEESRPTIRTSVLRTSVRDIVLAGVAAGVLGITTPIVLGIPFWIAMIWYFTRRRQLYLLIPPALFVLFSAVSAFAFWHSGLLTVTLIVLFWISPEREAQDPIDNPGVSRVVVISLLYTIAMQIAWTADVMHFDYKYPYSPDLAASRFLRPYVEANASIAVTYSRQTGISAYDAIGILPYFNRNIYSNLAQPFWVWSTQNTTETQFWRDLARKPEIVIVEFNESIPYDSALDAKNPRLTEIAAEGYSHTQTFCGAKLAQFRVLENTCHLVFQRTRN